MMYTSSTMQLVSLESNSIFLKIAYVYLVPHETMSECLTNGVVLNVFYTS